MLRKSAAYANVYGGCSQMLYKYQSCWFCRFNKRIEDFGGDLRAFNDYLEEVEEIVFNLVSDTDVQAMNARIEAYQRENQELIQRNTEKEVRVTFVCEIILGVEGR
jgi:hypothetical protein